MKSFITIFLLTSAIICFKLNAQDFPDTIIPYTGNSLKCKITLVNNTNVFYKYRFKRKVKSHHVALSRVKEIILNSSDARILNNDFRLKKRNITQSLNPQISPVPPSTDLQPDTTYVKGFSLGISGGVTYPLFIKSYDTMIAPTGKLGPSFSLSYKTRNSKGLAFKADLLFKLTNISFDSPLYYYAPNNYLIISIYPMLSYNFSNNFNMAVGALNLSPGLSENSISLTYKFEFGYLFKNNISTCINFTTSESYGYFSYNTLNLILGYNFIHKKPIKIETPKIQNYNYEYLQLSKKELQEKIDSIVNISLSQLPKAQVSPSTDYQSHTTELKTLTTHPKLSVTELVFSDVNHDQKLNSGEKAKIQFTLENNGDETAYNVEIELKEKNNLVGLVLEQGQKIGNLPPSKTIFVTLPVEGSQYLQNDTALFEITVTASNDSFVFSKSIIAVQSLGVNGSKQSASTDSTYRGSGDPLKGLNVSAAKQQMEIGKYYALIIGIDNYKGAWLPLKNAVRDAQSVENLLREKYKIDYSRTLNNELATRKNIMKELQWLADNVTEKDNVFIYYSGHGDFKKELNKGFWVPVDAETNEVYEFISNSDIQTYLNGIKSKHTLLISDACFSGDLFRGNTISVPFEQTSKYYSKVHSLKSRQALTSGGIEPIMDGGRDGHSIFTYYLLEMLSRNETKYYDSGQLYNDLKIPVTNNSDQTPILQPIKNCGDEGGQFIFIIK